MQNQPDQRTEEDDDTLNPSPRSYKVTLLTKSIFLVVFGLGLVSYGYIIVERRISQHSFLRDNRFGAISLSQKPAPNLSLKDPRTSVVTSLRDELSGWVLVNLWASWCPPCMEEMPSLEILQQKLEGKLKIVAIAVDDDIAAIEKFITSKKPSFKVLLDHEKLAPTKFGVDKYPETFLISPDGILAAQLSGPRDWNSKIALDYITNLIRL